MTAPSVGLHPAGVCSCRSERPRPGDRCRQRPLTQRAHPVSDRVSVDQVTRAADLPV